jgi:phospholipase/lecithinase/hemolysin
VRKSVGRDQQSDSNVRGDVQVAQKILSRTAVALGAGVAGALLCVSSANAGPYSAEYVFGDSLSDNGNLASLANVENFVANGFYFGNFPDPPSYHDSQTNGPVAVQLLAQSLGLNANPSLWVTGFADPAGLFGPSFSPGTNYAVAGATAAPGPQPPPGVPNINLPGQVGAFSGHALGHADPSALYVVMIGGNDVRDAALGGTGVVDSTGTAAIELGVSTEIAAISTLSSEGARDFLVVNVPNVGIIPEFAQENPSLATAATDYSQMYDSFLASGLAALDPTLSPTTSLGEFDLYTYNADILNSILDGTAHYIPPFTDTTDPCFKHTPFSAATTTGCGTNGANISSYIYWDHIHPTARVQAQWADGFRGAVPEPSTWAMLLVGFAGLGFAGYRSARKEIAA